MLRRDLKREETAARKAKEQAERARLEVVPELIEVQALRESVKAKLQSVAIRMPPPGAPDYLVEEEPEEGADDSRAEDEAVALARAKLHMHLRLQGTELPLPFEPWRTRTTRTSMIFQDDARAVTRHSLLPSIAPVVGSDRLPRPIDVLSAHRRRTHCPARRHFRVQPPNPKALRPRHSIEQSRSDAVIERQGKRGTVRLAPDRWGGPATNMPLTRSVPILPTMHSRAAIL